MKKIALLLALLVTGPAFAADNAVIVTPGTGVTMKSKDIGAGVQAMQPVISDTGGNALSTPTAGADGVSNTSTGLLSYGRNFVFNGTTWDRWLGDTTNGAFVNIKTSVLPTGASTSALQTTGNTSLATIATNTSSSIPAGSAIIGKVGIDQTTPGTTNGVQVNAALPAGTNAIGNLASQYPGGAIPLTASATGTTAATTATLAGAVGKTTYICSLSVRANATANTNVTDTVTGVITGTLSRALWVPANTAGLGVDEQIYSPCVPASATNTAIAVVSGAPGTGGVVTVNATGYQL